MGVLPAPVVVGYFSTLQWTTQGTFSTHQWVKVHRQVLLAFQTDRCSPTPNLQGWLIASLVICMQSRLCLCSNGVLVALPLRDKSGRVATTSVPLLAKERLEVLKVSKRWEKCLVHSILRGRSDYSVGCIMHCMSYRLTWHSLCYTVSRCQTYRFWMKTCVTASLSHVCLPSCTSGSS